EDERPGRLPGGGSARADRLRWQRHGRRAGALPGGHCVLAALLHRGDHRARGGVADRRLRRRGRAGRARPPRLQRRPQLRRQLRARRP
ncbi:MAG: hypothetical protein AVDCRST_MAG35-282, partial [uncultured Quadrisphaera sp.]